MLLFGGILLNRPETLSGKSVVTMKNLQDDFEFREPTYTLLGDEYLSGNFKSYKPGDTVLFRDRIVRVETSTKPLIGSPITNLVFEAYPFPHVAFPPGETEKSGNGTWYVWYYHPEEARAYSQTNFPINGENVPEAIISIDGDVSSRFSAGEIVEITFHVYNKFDFPGSTIVDENMREFKLYVSPNDIQVASGGISFNYAFYAGISFFLGGFLYMILAALLGIRRDMEAGRLGGIAALVLSCILGITLPSLFGKFGGWWLSSFVDSAGKILSPSFGGWWMQGFQWLTGLIVAVWAGYKVYTLNIGFFTKLGKAAITVTIGILVTFIVGAIVIFIPFSFLSATIPPFALNNIISIGMAVVGIAIPLMVGIFVVALTPEVMDGIVTKARSSPGKFIITVIMIVGIGSMAVGMSVGDDIWGPKIAAYLYVFGFVFTICLSITIFLWRRRTRAKKTTVQDSRTT
jgi:hypothetical protein